MPKTTEREVRSWLKHAEIEFEEAEADENQDLAYDAWCARHAEDLLLTATAMRDFLDAARERIADLEDIELELRTERQQRDQAIREVRDELSKAKALVERLRDEMVPPDMRVIVNMRGADLSRPIPPIPAEEDTL